MMLGRVGVLALAGVLCACSGGGGNDKEKAAARDTARQPAAEAETCRLMPLAEVAEITGLQLKPGEKTPDYMGYSRCVWEPVSGKPKGIQLVLNAEGNFGDYSNVPGATPVKGLGLEAVWNPRVYQLAVRRDTGTMSVSFLSEPAQRAWAEKIARKVLERLARPASGAPDSAAAGAKPRS